MTPKRTPTPSNQEQRWERVPESVLGEWRQGSIEIHPDVGATLKRQPTCWRVSMRCLGRHTRQQKRPRQYGAEYEATQVSGRAGVARHVMSPRPIASSADTPSI